MSKRPEASLAYSSPAHGGWGIVRVGMLVPECHQLFVCPFACGRHGAIGAIAHGYKERLSYLYIDETDVVSGGYERMIIEAATELLEAVSPRPKALLIIVSCLDDLLGTDHEAFLSTLRSRHPDVRFGVGHMNPISAEGKLPPAVNIQRSIYGFLEPASHRAGAVNLIGCHVAKHRDGELYRLLEGMGYEVRHIGACKTFAEYLTLAESGLNLVVGPTARTAAGELKQRLGIDSLYAPVSYDPGEIEGHYRALTQALSPGQPPPDWTAERHGLQEALAAARRLIGDRPIAVDDSATIRPYSLAKLLCESGFHLQAVCAEGCPILEKDSYAWLQANTRTELVNHTQHTAPVARRSQPELLAVGFECGYYFGSKHIVELLDDEELYGYHGIRLLLQKMCRAVEAETQLDDILNDYGLVV